MFRDERHSHPDFAKNFLEQLSHKVNDSRYPHQYSILSAAVPIVQLEGGPCAVDISFDQKKSISLTNTINNKLNDLEQGTAPHVRELVRQWKSKFVSLGAGSPSNCEWTVFITKYYFKIKYERAKKRKE